MRPLRGQPRALSSTRRGTTPKKGSVAEPGRSGQAPGSGAIITVPVCRAAQLALSFHMTDAVITD